MQPSFPWSSSASVFVIERMAAIHSLKCTMPFSSVVPLLSLVVTHCYLLSLVVTCCITCCHSLLLIVPFIVPRCHLLSLLSIRYHSLFCSLSLVVPLVVTRCHSLSFVVTRCTTRLYFYKWSCFTVVTLEFNQSQPIISIS